MKQRILNRGILPLVVAVTSVMAATRPQNVPKWEAVSIKPCSPAAGGERGRGAGPGGPQTPISGPGRLNLRCTTVARLIVQAYLSLPNGRRINQTSMEGGPAWINSDQYEINAKAEGTPSEEIMRGPMLRAILEDRFRLRTRSETREVPVYALTVAKSGFRLQRLEDGSCDPPDTTQTRPGRFTPQGFEEVLQPRQKPTCGVVLVAGNGGNEPGTTVYAQAANLAEFAGTIKAVLDRPVINKTDIPGIFNFRLRFAGGLANSAGAPPTSSTSPTAAADPARPSLFTAIQEQLGLKLDATRGPGEFLVVDSIERPTEN
jgi:uncharacterized protein (TIGR03435 family)